MLESEVDRLKQENNDIEVNNMNKMIDVGQEKKVHEFEESI